MFTHMYTYTHIYTILYIPICTSHTLIEDPAGEARGAQCQPGRSDTDHGETIGANMGLHGIIYTQNPMDLY